MELRRLSGSFYVADQLEAPDFEELASRGVKFVINNRPDGEANDQPSNYSLAEAAARAGLSYRYVPVLSKNVSQLERDAFIDVLCDMAGPVCAFCRTGTRASICWALSELGTQSTYAIVDAIVGAGFPSEDVELQLGINLQKTYAGNENGRR